MTEMRNRWCVETWERRALCSVKILRRDTACICSASTIDLICNRLPFQIQPSHFILAASFFNSNHFNPTYDNIRDLAITLRYTFKKLLDLPGTMREKVTRPNIYWNACPALETLLSGIVYGVVLCLTGATHWLWTISIAGTVFYQLTKHFLTAPHRPTIVKAPVPRMLLPAAVFMDQTKEKHGERVPAAQSDLIHLILSRVMLCFFEPFKNILHSFLYDHSLRFSPTWTAVF